MSRNLARSLSGLFTVRPSRRGANPSGSRRRRRPGTWVLEGLEPRVLLAATVYTVDAITDTGAGSGTTGDLLYCIDQANANANADGSLIQFDPTVFGTAQTIALSSTLTLSETAGSEVIDGPGANQVTVSGNNAVQVFSVASGVTATLAGLTISGGTADLGGGIWNQGTLKVSQCDVANNSANDGGGIENDHASMLTVSNSIIDNNSASSGGGIYDYSGTTTVSNSTIANNSAPTEGGGIYEFVGTVTVSNSTIEYNSASFYGGGGIYDYSGTTTVSNSTIDYNSASSYDGGGIDDDNGTVTVSNSTIEYNSASSDEGGGIYDDYGTVTVSNSTIDNNSAFEGGGIALGEGTVTVSYSSIDNNSAAASGGIDDYGGTVTVSNSTIDNNSASYYGGGGIEDDAGTVTVSNSTIDNNSAATGEYQPGGGGILLYGHTYGSETIGVVTVSNSTIDNNSAGTSGGGIYGDGGVVTVSNSTIDNNSAAVGGGVDYEDVDTATVSNSTIDNNSASDYGGGIHFGGEIYYRSDAMTVSNSTIDNNSASYYGGILFNPAEGITLTAVSDTIAYNSVASGSGGGLTSRDTVILDNTIVALNTIGTGNGAPASDVDATVSSSSAYNLIGTGGSGGLINGTNGNQVGVVNPGLGTLADNGGPTPTIALLLSSPAIDAGSNALAVDPSTGQPLTTDQRGPGYSRIVNGTVDIGAFEVQTTNHLAVTAQPPSSVTAGSGFGLTVTAEDGSGNVESSFNGTVTVALLNNPGSATLGGTLTATADDGVATFSGLTLNKTGTGYTLLVSADGLIRASTDSFDVSPAAATQLVVTSQPAGSVIAGSPFSLSVVAEDPYNNVDTNFDANLTVGLSANPGGATLGGTLMVAAQNGMASFSDLTLDQTGIGYTLQVSGTGLTAATTSPFTVQTTVGSSVGVDWGTSGSAMLQTASDGLRLLPAGRNSDLPWLGIAQLQITLAQAAPLAAGDITVIGTSGTNYGPVTVSGSGTSYTITLAQPINAADRVTITIGNATIATYTRRLDVLPGDVNDDGVVNSQDLALVRNQWLGVNGTQPTIFGDINGDGVVNVVDYNDVRAEIGASLPDVSAAQLVVTAQPPAGVTAGARFALTVSVENSSGNVDTSFNGMVTVALANNPDGATLGGTLRVTARAGVATFSDLTLDELGIGYTLQVSSIALPAATTRPFNVQTTVGSSVGVDWGTSGAATLQTAGDGLRLLPAGRNTDLPWLGIAQLQITLAQATSLAAGDISVIGASGINYGPVTLSGSGTSYTIALAQPINAADRVTITIGNATIATYTRQLDVLPGDVNDDGVVNSQDLALVRNQWLGVNGTQPTIFGDINGDGVVNVDDYNDVRAAIGTSLPGVGESAAATSVSSGTGVGAGEVVVSIATASQPAPIAMPAPTTVAAQSVVSIGTTSQPAPNAALTIHPASTRARPRHEIRLAARGRRRDLEESSRSAVIHRAIRPSSTEIDHHEMSKRVALS